MTSDLPPVDAPKPRRVTRRGFGVLAGVVIICSSVFAANWFNVIATNDSPSAVSVAEAHRAAEAGEILLVDIRRPDEWVRTGIGTPAQPIDMRRDDFIDTLLAQADKDPTRPVALICARGVRSKQMAARLADAGFTQIIDVPEGMLGSGAGPGWLRSGLPVKAWQDG